MTWDSLTFSSVWVIMSTVTSTGGSIANVRSPVAVAYRSSKAALNMAMRMYSIELKKQAIIVGIIAP